MVEKYSKLELQFRKKRNKEEMQYQFLTFAIMIFLTFISFTAVLFQDKVSPIFIVPFIFLLAIVQVVFQLYYFMHMKHKGHGIPSLFIYGGIIVGVITIFAFLTIIWI